MDLALKLTEMKEERWVRFYGLLEVHYVDDKLSIDWLCQEAGISRMHLHRIIKEKTGLSTSHFIRQFRLEKAIELLKSDHTISEIAFAVGFKNPSYFTRVFTKNYGCSPSTFR